MKKATEARDDTKRTLSELNTTIVTTSNERDELSVEIAGLGSEISALSKGLSEETLLHNETMLHLEKKIADATIGETAVADAIDVLQTYYGSVAVTGDNTPEEFGNSADSDATRLMTWRRRERSETRSTVVRRIPHLTSSVFWRRSRKTSRTRLPTPRPRSRRRTRTTPTSRRTPKPTSTPRPARKRTRRTKRPAP